MRLFAKLIAVCDFTSPDPPHLEHIGVPKSLTVYQLIMFSKNCICMICMRLFAKPIAVCDFTSPDPPHLEHIRGPQIAYCI